MNSLILFAAINPQENIGVILPLRVFSVAPLVAGAIRQFSGDQK